jgi:cellulose synthase/poly-beta-1,6-N-acetylglucosamine synthase-like glycosyltransferase
MLNVIIPTRNSEDVLETCLKSLSLQTMPVKIIIVDANSTDKTREIATRYGCTVLDEPKSSGMGSKRAVACNYGLKFVDSELTAFLDSDTEIPPQWAEDMEKTFLNLKGDSKIAVAGISSGCIPDISSDLSIAINIVMKKASNHAQDYKDFVIINSLPGYNVVYRTEILKEVGGFNEELGGAEDWEINFRIRKRGYTLLGIPNSPVIHHERKTIEGLKKQLRGYGWSWGRMLTVKHFFLPSRAIPALIILLSPVIIVLPFIFGVGTFTRFFGVFVVLCWDLAFFIHDWEFKNKYFMMLKVVIILEMYFGIGYIRALLNHKA